MTTKDELEELQAQYLAVLAEYRRVGVPLLDQAVALRKQIRDIKRERGELFYTEYARYRSQYTDEHDTLEDAKGSLRAMEDEGTGAGIRIYGPGVELKDDEWRD